MKECCIRGVKHDGTPEGTIKEVGGSTPSSSNGNGILFIPDAFGLELPNNKLMADEFAAAGYTTVIPDIFRGNPVPPNALSGGGDFDLGGWISTHPADIVEPILVSTIKGMKELGVKKVGAVGYCFGGRYVIRFLGDGKIDAGFAAHPSLVEDEEVSAVKGPLSLACAETDSIFPSEKRATAEANLAKTKVPYESTVYGGTQHGFAIRCDLSDPKQKYAKESAFHQAIKWFSEFL